MAVTTALSKYDADWYNDVYRQWRECHHNMGINK